MARSFDVFEQFLFGFAVTSVLERYNRGLCACVFEKRGGGGGGGGGE